MDDVKLDLNWGKPAQAAPAESPKVAEKKAQLQDAAISKMAIYGTPEQQRVIATADAQGNRLGQSPAVDDILTLNPVQFAQKYGFEAEANRWRYADAAQKLREEKARERTTGQLVGDSANDVARMAGNIVGGIATVGGLVADEVLNSTTTPYISEGLGKFNDWMQSYQSQNMQDARAQEALEGELDKQDRKALYEERLAANAHMDSSWERSVKPWLQKAGSAVSDTLGNLADNPAVAGALVPEAVGSMLPIALGTKAVSTGGRVVAATALMGAAESGSAANQVQQEIMAMTADELNQNPEYKQLREAGLSHREAQRTVAADIGIKTGAMTLPGALAAGRLAAPFAANPLRWAPKGAAREGVTDILRETGEEFIQESNSQLMGNIAMNSAGFERALDDGVIEAGVKGAVGGMGSTVALKTPGAMLDGLGAAAGGARNAASAAVDARQDRINARLDATSAVGTAAQEKAGDVVAAAGQAILDGLVNHTAPQQIEALPEDAGTASASEPAEASPNERASATIRKGLVLDAAEEADMVESYPGLKAFRDANPDAPIRRDMVIREAGENFDTQGMPEDLKTVFAVQMLQSLDAMRSMDGTDTAQTVEALAADDPVRSGYEALRSSLATIESSPKVAKAQEYLKSLTPDQVRERVAIELLSDPASTPEIKQAVGSMLETIASVNPEAVTLEDYDLVLNQIPVSKNSKSLRDRIEAARKALNVFLRTDKAKAKIEEEQAKLAKEDAAAVPEGAPAPAPRKVFKTSDTVREEIAIKGNSNKMPSLKAHHAAIVQAARVGRTKEAQEALQELRHFAQSQANKVAALNTSATNGDGKKVPYVAYGPFKFFSHEPSEGVYVNLKSRNSIALAHEIHADAKAAADLADVLANGYGLGGNAVTVPDLAPVILARSASTPAVTTPPKPDAKAAVPPAPKPAASKPAAPGPAPEAMRTTDEVPPAAPVEETNEPAADPVAQIPGPTAQEATQGTSEPAAETQDPVAEETPAEETSTEETSEEEQEEDQDEDATEEAPVVSWFHRLKKILIHAKDGANTFLDHFRPGKSGSTLTAHEDPSAWLLKSLKENSLDGVNLSDAERQALIETIEETLPSMTKMLEDVTQDFLKSRGWTSMDAVQQHMNYANTRSLSFLTADPEGRMQYEKRISDALAMVVFEWMLANAGPQRAKDNEDVNKMFGRPRGSSVTAEEQQAANFGMSSQAVMEQIANKMMRLLDVAPKSDSSLRYTQGLFKGLVSNALESLLDTHATIESKDSRGRKRTEYLNEVTENGLISWYTQAYTTADGEPSTMIMMKANAAVNEDEGFKTLARLRDPFSRIFTPKGTKPRYIDEPPEQVARTQMNNRFAETSRLSRKAMKRLQNTPSYLVTPMVELAEALGSDNFNILLGGKPLSQEQMDRMNPDHLVSIMGKNASLDREYLETFGYVEEVRKQMGNRALNEVPIYHTWSESSVGRLQQEGPITPQGSKTAREMISATQSTLDLTDPAHQDALWLAVAQSLGVKVEKLKFSEAIEEAQKLLTNGGVFEPALNLLQTWLTTKELDTPALMKALEGKAVSPKVLHALVTVARANEAKGTPEETAFQTALAFEADGKTDGPINAMIHMGLGEFTPAQIEAFAKGGLFFTDRPISLNQFIEMEKKGGEDLYTMAATLFRQKLKDMVGSEAGADVESTLRVLHAFLPEFIYGVSEDGAYDPKIGRDVVKNPLTVFLYGSGLNGIAQKLAGRATDTMAEMMSEISAIAQAGGKVTDHPKFLEHHDPENGADLVQAMADMFFMGNKADMLRWLRQPTVSRMQPFMFKRFALKVEEHFASPMLEAVDEVTGGLAQHMRFTQAAASVQTVIFQDLFQKRIEAWQEQAAAAQVKSQDPKDTRKQGKPVPSTKELEDIFAEVMKVAPIFGSDAQSFHISAPKKEVQDGIKVSESFSNRLPVRASTIEPSDASVKVSPYLTIGTGDGRMILNIYVNADGSLDTSLPVFDGVELSVENMAEGALQINEQVYKGWMEGNPYEMISQGFDQLMAYLTPELFQKLSDSTLKQIGRSLELQKGEVPELAHIEAMQERLQDMSDEAAARKYAMKKLGMSVDHMAGSQDPYHAQGEVVANGDPLAFEAITQRLNELAAEAPRKHRKAAQPYQLSPSKELTEAVERIGTKVPGHKGVTQINGKAIMRLLTRHNGTSEEVLKLLRELQEMRAVPEDALFFFGEAKALEALRDAEFKKLPKAPIQAGQTFSRSKVTFIANISSETLAHEMLHGYTAGILQDHYADPSASPEHVRQAVAQLEALRDDVLSLAPKGRGDAISHLQKELRKAAKVPAAQISELISYMLSNQDLIQSAQAVKSYRHLTSLFQRGLKMVKQLLGLKSLPPANLYAQIRQSTQLLVAEAPVNDQSSVDQVLEQTFGENPRLATLEKQFFGQLLDLGNKLSNKTLDEKKLQVAKLRQGGQHAAMRAVAQGFTLNPREQKTFEAIHAAVTAGLKSDQPVMRQLFEAYSHVAKTLKAEDFLKAWGIENPSQLDLEHAARLRDYLVSVKGIRSNANGRSDILASFLALSQTSPDLRSVLGQVKPPKVVELKWDSVDNWLKSLASTVVNILTRASMKPRRMAKTVGAELDLLTATLGEIQGERKLLALLSQFNGLVEQANDWTSGKVDSAADKATQALQDKADKAKNKAVKAGLRYTSWVTALGSDTQAAAHAEMMTTNLNRIEGFKALRSAFSDIRGMTDSNRPLMRLINPVKAGIDALRQDYREGVPEELAQGFSRKLKREEWQRMHQGIMKTDLLALGQKEAEALLKDPSDLAQKISAAEKAVLDGAKVDGRRMLEKAQALAIRMVRGEVTSQNLLRNAYAIAQLFGEQRGKGKALEAQATPELIEAIDRLATLYAMKELDPADLKTLTDLMASQESGMQTVLGFQGTVRALEQERRNRHGGENKVALLNGWKGYAPSVAQEGMSLIVMDDLKHDELVRQGYTRVGDYKGDSNEGRAPVRGYYLSSVGGRGAFRQGVAQTVHETWQGVSANTGITVGGETAGVLAGARAEKLAERLNGLSDPTALNGLAPGEYLMPVLDEDGAIVAFERPMSADMLKRVRRDTHMGRMLGNWAGRILEENAADEFNQELVGTLKDLYDQGMKAGRGKEFIDISDPNQKDPVIKDAWNTLGWRIKAEFAEAFGDEGVWIRKDMVDDAIGYRAPSVTDPWTGITNWSPETQKRLQGAAELILGAQAFKYLKKGEGYVHDAVSFAKTTIIVRSIKVGVDNIASNFLHLWARGVPLRTILKGSRDKFVEIVEYVKNREEIQALQVQMGALAHDPVRSRPLASRIQALEEANARMSIAPLIAAGEFSTISENLTEADVAIREGRWADFMEKAADQLPVWAQGVGKNALMTKDSAMFQGLNRMVQYGDFVAKAVLYDHLTQVKKKTERETLDILFEEFVPYNRLPGRVRDAIEGYGLGWFWNYTLRITKIAAGTVKDRPLTALMMLGGVGPSSGIDTVWDGSLPGKVLDGGLGFKIGPEMGLNAPFLHPLWSLAP